MSQKTSSSLLDAVAEVLQAAGEPLRPTEITKRMLSGGLWTGTGKTPEQTVHARLAMDIKQRADASRFIRVAPGTFALRTQTGTALVAKALADRPMSFTEAAQWVLGQSSDRKPMHYKSITETAIASGHLKTGGATPEATMYVQLVGEIERRQKRGDEQRFLRHPKGYFGLASWQQSAVSLQISAHNQKVRQALLHQLLDMKPQDFQKLVVLLLTKMGLQDVTQSSYTADGGVDIRGTIVVGDAISTRVAVQVKRWRHNVQAPVVQQIRGALGAHENALIVTTSSFGKGGRDEAARSNAAPVGLIDGDQLIRLLAEYELGVRKTQDAPLELKQEGFGLGVD